MQARKHSLQFESWSAQQAHWPDEGRHILAQYDADSVVVYQAYRPEIAVWAVENQQFGGPWSFSRMSWIKTNFLWMMYRSGWGTKPGQEHTLAIWLKRPAFDEILSTALSSRAPDGVSVEAWRDKLRDSDVRLQWDPDHGPRGEKVLRRAVQLGLRGEVLKAYSSEWLLEIQDVSDLVEQQRQALKAQGPEAIRTPSERIYRPSQVSIADRIRLSS